MQEPPDQHVDSGGSRDAALSRRAQARRDSTTKIRAIHRKTDVSCAVLRQGRVLTNKFSSEGYRPAGRRTKGAEIIDPVESLAGSSGRRRCRGRPRERAAYSAARHLESTWRSPSRVTRSWACTADGRPTHKCGRSVSGQVVTQRRLRREHVQRPRSTSTRSATSRSPKPGRDVLRRDR